MRIILLFFVIMWTTRSIHAESPYPLQSDDWIVYIEDGKSHHQAVKLLPSTSLLEMYRENLTIISPWDIDDLPEGAHDPLLSKNLTVTNIGQWHDYTVFDVTNPNIRHKSIILQNQWGQSAILYTQFHWSTAFVADLPFFAEANGQTILAYTTDLPGTGHFYREYYFVYDEETRLPHRLSLEPIAETLHDILPEGYSVWKGGGFDIQQLTYSHAVWKDGDGNCCPSGGRIDMQLELKNDHLIVTDVIYNSEYTWP